MALILDGVSGETLGLVVEHRAPRPVPRRKTLSWDVPGRTGRVVRELDAWETITLSYEIAIRPALGRTLSRSVDAVVAWLTAAGERRLVDTDDAADLTYLSYTMTPYTLARLSNADALRDQLHRSRKATLRFDADPRRWYEIASWEWHEYYSGSGVYNPTFFRAKPILRITGAGAGTVTLGASTFAFTDCSGAIVDCEAQTSTKAFTVTGGWPSLNAIAPNSNIAVAATPLSYTGGVTKVEVKPRWYSL